MPAAHPRRRGAYSGLYMALRLASLERYLDASEPLPLGLDDVLIQFDDERARAALESWRSSPAAPRS